MTGSSEQDPNLALLVCILPREMARWASVCAAQMGRQVAACPGGRWGRRCSLKLEGWLGVSWVYWVELNWTETNLDC